MASKAHLPPTLGLVLVRIVTGWVFVAHGWSWLQGEGAGEEALRRWVDNASETLHPAFAWWGENVLLYNPSGSLVLWEWSALVLGVLLTLGALTRPVGWIAVFFLLNAFAFGPESHELVFLLLLVSSLACALSRAGRRFGFDKLFDGYFPGWVTWTRTPSSFLS